MKCCFCKKDAGKFGNNALPIMKGRCCDDCNEDFVIPMRILRATNSSLLRIISESREQLKKFVQEQENETNKSINK
jgi:hypothetical protein